MKNVAFGLIGSLCLIACGSGGSNNGGFQNDPTPPSSNPSIGNYLGTLYSGWDSLSV